MGRGGYFRQSIKVLALLFHNNTSFNSLNTMATEVADNYDSLIKEMELLKSRLEEERSKLNDVARNIDQ